MARIQNPVYDPDSDVPDLKDLNEDQFNAMGPALTALQGRIMCDACRHWIANDSKGYKCSKCTDVQHDLCELCFEKQKTGCDHENRDYVKT